MDKNIDALNIEQSQVTGEFNIKKFLAFLKSFWGLLAAFSVILPTIIYFFNIAQVKTSVLSGCYISVPTTFALLIIPIAFLFEKDLSNSLLVKKISIIFLALSLITIFAFITTKSIFISNKQYSIQINNGYGKINIKESNDGRIELLTYDDNHSDEPKQKEQRINVYELISLVMYTMSVILLTAAFSCLGVFFYTKNVQ